MTELFLIIDTRESYLIQDSFMAGDHRPRLFVRDINGACFVQ